MTVEDLDTLPDRTVAVAPVRLRLTEIFLSLQGEASRVGLPTVFVRLTGCPLRCGYCDTAYAFHGGETFALETVVERVRSYGVPRVTVTGGEPLAQKGCLELLRVLCDAGFDVSLETSGALDVANVDARVSRIVDLKTPASGEMARNLWANLDHLNARDEIKFVLCDRGDYEWARSVLRDRALAQRSPVLFSPSFGQMEPRELAQWILEDRLPVRMQLQLHKVLWGETPGH
jgi:7-carboxy-7-deazaguanine synthase